MNPAAAAAELQTAAVAQTLNLAAAVAETQTVAAAQSFLFQAVAGETPAGEQPMGEHLVGVGAKNRCAGAFSLLARGGEEKRGEGEEKRAGSWESVSRPQIHVPRKLEMGTPERPELF